MTWEADSERYYRKQADEIQAELDQFADPVWLERRIAALTSRRDQWVRLADECRDWARRDQESALFGEGS